MGGGRRAAAANNLPILITKMDTNANILALVPILILALVLVRSEGEGLPRESYPKKVALRFVFSC